MPLQLVFKRLSCGRYKSTSKRMQQNKTNCGSQFKSFRYPPSCPWTSVPIRRTPLGLRWRCSVGGIFAACACRKLSDAVVDDDAVTHCCHRNYPCSDLFDRFALHRCLRLSYSPRGRPPCTLRLTLLSGMNRFLLHLWLRCTLA